MRKLQIVAFLLIAMTFCACGGGSHPVGVTATPAQLALNQGEATVVTASVTNDASNSGVSFALSCSVSSCGTLSGATSTSVTYTAPSTVASQMPVTITAKSVKDGSRTANSVITVNPSLAIAAPPGAQLTGTVGGAYSLSLGSGGTAPFTWQLTSGTLPAGLTLNASANTGAAVITGTPTVAGSSTVTVKVTDSSGCMTGKDSASQQLTIVVANAAFKVVTSSLPSGVVNTAYSQPLQASGGTTPYTWSVASGSSLPSWLSIGGSGTNWTLSGTPTATGTSTFALSVTDSSIPPKTLTTAQLSLTINAVNAACGSGKESALSGQYAFILSGFGASSNYMASIGSFTADGKGGISGGAVDSNSAAGGYVANNAITPAGSSYSVGSDLRGCATIVTSSGTFAVRFALESTPSGAAPEGAIEAWESGSGAWIATGQILKQTVPTAISNGTFVYAQTGFHSGGTRDAVIGTFVANNLAITGGEYDSNFAGSHSNYSGITGSYTATDANGRFTDTTSLYGVTAYRVLYAVTASQFFELSTLPISSYPILVGKGQLQSGSLALSGNLVYYASGWETSGAGGFVQLARLTASGTSFTANVYENDAGVWENPDPRTMTCAFTAPDAAGRVTTSGTGCGTYQGTYPPVFYLTGPNTGVMMGTDPGVLAGQLQPQTTKAISAGTYYFGTQEVVNQQALTETGSASVASGGAVTGTSDQIAAGSQLPNQAISDTMTASSTDGSITDSKHPAQPMGYVISPNQLVIVDGQSSTYPTILIIKALPAI